MKYLLIAFSFAFLSSVAFGGELDVKPEKPMQGDTLELIYSRADFFSAGEELFAYFYSFDNKHSEPFAFESPMIYDSTSGKYFTKATVPDGSTFLLMKIGDGVDFDDNRTKYWETLVYNRLQKPLRGANLAAGVVRMGNLPPQYDRLVDFEAALDYLEAETELYPDNIQAIIGLTSLKYDLKKITKSLFQDKMLEAAGMKFDADDENEVKAVSRALRVVNQNDRADQIERKYAIDHPKSELAEEMVLTSLAKAESLSEFSEGVMVFLKNYLHSDSRDRIFSAFVTGYLQSGKYDELKTKLAELPEVPASVYAQLAFAMLEDDKIMPGATSDAKIKEADTLMQIAVIEASKDKYNLTPRNLTVSEWKRRRELTLAAILQSYGDFYLKTEDFDKAAEKYRAAEEILGDDSGPALYVNLTSALTNLGKDTLAYQTTVEAILNSVATDEIYEMHEDLFEKVKTIGQDYDLVIDSLRKQAEMQRLAELEREKLDIDERLGELKRLDGVIVDIGDFDGVRVIALWSSWAGPAQEALPVFEELEGDYADDDSVRFFAVNVWEKEGDREEIIREYVESAGLEIPIYIDITDRLPRVLGTVGLPTFYFVDKSGKTQFKITGFDFDERFLRDAKDRIEYLKRN